LLRGVAAAAAIADYIDEKATNGKQADRSRSSTAVAAHFDLEAQYLAPEASVGSSASCAWIAARGRAVGRGGNRYVVAAGVGRRASLRPSALCRQMTKQLGACTWELHVEHRAALVKLIAGSRPAT